MSIEFIGLTASQESSETLLPHGPAINKEYLGSLARAHEYAVFDRVLIAHSSSSVDGLQVAAFMAQQTERLGILLAHRPGFVSPTDHHGKHYRYKGQNAGIRPLRERHLPIYFGGASNAAIEVAAKHADVYALWGESLAQLAETIAKVRAAAARYGREGRIRFSLSLRPILADTEEKACARADQILEQATANVGKNQFFTSRPAQPQNAGSQRLLATAAQGKVVDERLWTGIAALTRASGNSTGLVGTPDQVRDALLKYVELGISTILIRGFDPIHDALQYGRELIPQVRKAVAEREAQAGAATRLAA